MSKLLRHKTFSKAIYDSLIQKKPLTTSTKRKDLIISCKHSRYNLYKDTVYKKFEDIPLASKGWHHQKSKGDFFCIHSQLEPEDLWQFTPFNNLHVPPELTEALKSQGIAEATNFQAQVLEAIRKGRNTLVAAETGCGKTVGYLLPVIENLIGKKQTEMNTPKALVVVPNRELAEQIGHVASALAQTVGLNVTTLIGGNVKRLMMNPEYSEVDILVGTPGVLSKLSTVGVYRFSDVEHLVLDEADTLMDDSFEDKVTNIIKRVPKAQVILVSATYPRTFIEILEPIRANLVQVISPRLHMPLLNVRQKFLRLSRSAKPAELLTLAKLNKQPMLVFSNKNETCDWVAIFLRENGLNCSNINGNMNRHIRIAQWNDFCSNKTNILSATDVGSRGLDMLQVTHVVNYDFPIYMADYIHRVGRTGRLGSKSHSKITNFVSGNLEVELVQKIELSVRRNQPLPDVDGNTTNIFQKHILQQIRQQSELKETIQN